MLKLHKREIERLAHRIETDHANALSDHDTRKKRFAEYYRMFRNRVEAPPLGSEEDSNFSVPFLQWQMLSKWAEICQRTFGENAELNAEPIGPSDERNVRLVSCYMTWRVLKYMDAVLPFATWFFRAILFGRAFAFCPYTQKTFKNGAGEREIYYDGPEIQALGPDEIVVPSEDVDSIQKFSFVIRKFTASLQSLVDGEREERYFKITKDPEDEKCWETIVNACADGIDARGTEGNEVKQEADENEGVSRENSLSGSGIEVHCWYGRWRLPKRRTADVQEHEHGRREIEETELMVYYLPSLSKVIGIQDLAVMYPDVPERRPIQEIALNCDGTYWTAGLGELLETIQDELSDGLNKFTDGLDLSVCPPGFYEPSTGVNPKAFKLKRKMMYPTTNAQGINFLQIHVDAQGALLHEQAIRTWGERVSGQSDQSTGHVSGQPNAPDTARGQMLLAEQGNVRAFLDAPLFIRYHLRRVLKWIWSLDRMFAPPNLFFRVTEDDAKGMFEVRGGGNAINVSAEEFNGGYDFDIKFATSIWSKEADAQKTLQRYQLDLLNPLIANNPRALWVTTQAAHKALGDSNFSDIVPEPPDLGQPKPPKEEWTLMLQGERVECHPNDNDDLHLIDHFKRLEMEKQAPRPDQGAIALMAEHIIATQSQKRQKLMIAALSEGVARMLATNTAVPGGAGLHAQGGGTPMSLMNLQGALTNLTGGGGDGTQAQGGGQGQPGGGAAGPAGPAGPGGP